MSFFRILPVASILVSCASPPGSISPTYVSPEIYRSYSCNEIITERQRIVAKVNELTGHQSNKATGDAVAMAVGLIVFWPALFLIAAGKDKEAELASYKGTYEALEQAGIKKRCFKPT